MPRRGTRQLESVSGRQRRRSQQRHHGSCRGSACNVSSSFFIFFASSFPFLLSTRACCTRKERELAPMASSEVAAKHDAAAHTCGARGSAVWPIRTLCVPSTTSFSQVLLDRGVVKGGSTEPASGAPPSPPLLPLPPSSPPSSSSSPPPPQRDRHQPWQPRGSRKDTKIWVVVVKGQHSN